MPIFTGKSQKFLQRRFFLITNIGGGGGGAFPHKGNMVLPGR